MALLEVENLYTRFDLRSGTVNAVNGVSYRVEPGQTLGIAGESGSGKSVAQYSILGLLPQPPGRIERGSAHFEGKDLLQLPKGELRAVRGGRIGMVFQDPMTALNPYLRIGTQLTEPLRIHRGLRGKEATSRAIEALERVGLHDAERRLRQYPHQFSGGMRQRVVIAMALITDPALLIADEPTTALDVTVQAQILDLIRDLQRERGMGVVLITHDLGVVAGYCDRVCVMYAGRIVEEAPVRPLFAAPKHPYTRALLQSLPARHASGDALTVIPGQPPDMSRSINGCAFAPRCRHTSEPCVEGDCTLAPVAPDHTSACVRLQRGEIE